MVASPMNKTEVIRRLFYDRFDLRDGSAKLEPGASPVVTGGEIEAALDALGMESGKNRANNFWKDLTRNSSLATTVWPRDVLAAGWTATDAIGYAAAAKFEFVNEPDFPVPPFPDSVLLANPITIPSLSLPVAARMLGGGGENWIAQMAVRLQVIEMHFAARSPLSPAHVSFVQTGRSTRVGEVDGVWRLDGELDLNHRLTPGSETMFRLAAVEVKSHREWIWEPQLRRASISLHAAVVKDSYKHKLVAPQEIVPLALKVLSCKKLKRPLVQVVEYVPVNEHSDPRIPLVVATHGVYEFRPPINLLS